MNRLKNLTTDSISGNKESSDVDVGGNVSDNSRNLNVEVEEIFERKELFDLNRKAHSSPSKSMRRTSEFESEKLPVNIFIQLNQQFLPLSFLLIMKIIFTTVIFIIFFL